jgi:glutamate racemase
MRVLVFDSGIGGVGVAQALRRLMPGACLTYLMDNAGFPYGGRSDADLVARVQGVVGAGIALAAPDLVVVACNTASTMALDALRRAQAIPFVGCVPPISWAARLTRTGSIGVLATPATARGRYLPDLAARFAANCDVMLHGAPRLAALAEAHFAGEDVTESDLRAELRGLLEQPGARAIDVMALGCTHYGWLLPKLRCLMPESVAWLDPAEPVARQALRVATERGAGNPADTLDGTVLHTGDAPNLAPAPWREAGFVSGLALGLTRHKEESLLF